MYFRVSSDHGESASQDNWRPRRRTAFISNPCPRTKTHGSGGLARMVLIQLSLTKLLGQGRRCAYVALQTPIGKAIAFCNLLKLVLHRLVICFDHMPCSSSRMLHAGSPPRTCTHETRMMGKCILHFTFPAALKAALAAQQDLFSECKTFTWPLS